MKNKATNYLIRGSNIQIKSIVDRKKNGITDASSEKAMTELKKIYWYEKQLLIAIPILMSSATTFELVESLTLLSDHTREHIKVLESKFPEINKITMAKEHTMPSS